MSYLNCFGATRVSGKIGPQLNPKMAYRIGRAFADYLYGGTVVIGGDNRMSTHCLKQALTAGLRKQGADVIDVGLCGSEQVLFATRDLKADGGLMITGHTAPSDYNGILFVDSKADPIHNNNGLNTIGLFAGQNQFTMAEHPGRYRQHNQLDRYVFNLLSIFHCLSGYSLEQINPLKVVVNSGNGVSGHVVEALEKEFQKRRIPITLIKLEFCPTTASALPDSTHTIRAVLQHQADFGVTWNHDFSRCYMFDEHGQMVEHAAITCLLAQLFLQRYPQQTIVHRVNANRWQNNIKQQMQASNAIYASTDNSGHYFRHLAYCQSGMLPWLLIIELLSRSAKPLSVLAEGYSNNTLPINSTNRIAAQDASHWISVA